MGRVAPVSSGHQPAPAKRTSFKRERGGDTKKSVMDHELTVAIMHKQNMDNPSLVTLFEILILYVQQFSLITKLKVPWSARWLKVVAWSRLALFDLDLSTDAMKLVNFVFVLILPLCFLRMVDGRFRLAQNERTRLAMESLMEKRSGMLRPLLLRFLFWLIPQGGMVAVYIYTRDENIIAAFFVWCFVGFFPFQILWKRCQFYLKCKSIEANMIMFWTNVLRTEHNSLTFVLADFESSLTI